MTEQEVGMKILEELRRTGREECITRINDRYVLVAVTEVIIGTAKVRCSADDEDDECGP
jgi:hypothetical protein